MTYVSVSDDEAVGAFHLLSRQGRDHPGALESSHAVAYAVRLAVEDEEGRVASS